MFLGFGDVVVFNLASQGMARLPLVKAVSQHEGRWSLSDRVMPDGQPPIRPEQFECPESGAILRSEFVDICQRPFPDTRCQLAAQKSTIRQHEQRRAIQPLVVDVGSHAGHDGLTSRQSRLNRLPQRRLDGQPALDVRGRWNGGLVQCTDLFVKWRSSIRDAKRVPDGSS